MNADGGRRKEVTTTLRWGRWLPDAVTWLQSKGEWMLAEGPGANDSHGSHIVKHTGKVLVITAVKIGVRIEVVLRVAVMILRM